MTISEDPNSPEFVARRAEARKALDAIDPAMHGGLPADPLRREWFEAVYARADNDPARVPWANLAPHPLTKSWVDTQARGIAGLVIDGGVRDVSALARHGFPVFSTLIALTGATKVGGGSIAGSAKVGDVMVTTGDWVVGDADGVTVIPRASLDEVVAAGVARAAKEDGFFLKLRDGTTTVDLLGLDTRRVERRTSPPP